MIRHPSPNFGPRRAGLPIDMLVLHYTGMKTAEAALLRLCDPAAMVSAHYLIDEAGAVFALVDEDARAWHAGIARWRGESDVNGRSIGIELVNPGHEFGYRQFPSPQIAALTTLCQAILARHAIPARNVVGHSDVAPARKTDPGELFDWPALAAAGIGLWPVEAGPPVAAGEAPLAADLARYGYDVANPMLAIAAFQRHFRRSRIDGRADPETASLARTLLALAEER